jgi:hypothetical protein
LRVLESGHFVQTMTSAATASNNSCLGIADFSPFSVSFSVFVLIRSVWERCKFECG